MKATLPLKVSAIMTVYNGEKYIEQSINSLLNQTYSNWELCVFLDGCTDSTESIILRLQEAYGKKFNILKGNHRQGCPFGRMEAIRASSGLYMAIQDADDISFPTRLEKQVNLLKKHPEIFCVGSFATKIDEKGVPFNEMTYPPQEHADIIKMTVEDCRNPMIDPSVMFRKDLFYELGGYSTDENTYTVPDFELWLKAMSKSKIFHNLQETLVQYRIHEKGVTVSRQREMILHHMIVWKKYIHILKCEEE